MSDTPTDPMLGMVEEYALGQLDDGQSAAFEARLAIDPRLQQALAATMESLATMALSTPVAPSPQLKARVMAQVAAANAPQARVLPYAAPVRRSRAPLWLGAALAASLMLVAKLTFDLRNASAATAAAQLAASASERALVQRDSLIAQLTDPGAELVTLAATGQAKPIIKAFVSRARRTMMVSAALLETLPAGSAYQLWFIVDGKPVPSITFKGDSTGRALLQQIAIPSGAVAAAAITVEPEAGSSAPTTPVLFVGKLATELP